jgi:RNA polymerase-binding transcription factor DksA
MKSSIDEDEIRTLLRDERSRLQQIRAGLSVESPDGAPEEDALRELTSIDQHPADIGSETFEREKDMSILEHVDAQLAEVDRALVRLEQGTYGLCEACGRQIDRDRLLARPSARFCIDDQAKSERGIS